MARTGARPLRVSVTCVALSVLAGCGASTISAAPAPSASSSPSQTPSTTPPQAPFVLDCLEGVSGTSTDYEFAGEATTYPTPEGVASRAIAAHPEWQAVVSVMGEHADVALFGATGRVEGIMRVVRQGSGWSLSADRACNDITLYR